MAGTLQDRFLTSSIRSFRTLLQITGIYLSPPSESKSRRYLNCFWSWFWVVFCLQGHIWIAYKRIRILNDYFNIMARNSDVVVELINAIFRLSALTVDTVVHVTLIFTIWPTIKSFLEILESVDKDLKRPLLLRVQWVSLIGLIYMFLSINLYWFFNISWELYHPIRPVVTIDIIQNTIRLFRYWFTALPIWLFAICGQLLVLYFDKIYLNLKSLLDCSMVSNTNTKGIESYVLVEQALEIVGPLKRLNSATDLLYRRLSIMLLANCFKSTIFMLTSSYYVIDYSIKKLVLVTCWDASLVIENFLFFWLMCHVSDRLQGATRKCIPFLRHIRDGYCGTELTFTERMRLTLYIIEIAQCQKDVSKRSLHGLLPLSKHLILKAIDTISTFLIIIFQFK